jgi:hypothetical protein
MYALFCRLPQAFPVASTTLLLLATSRRLVLHGACTLSRLMGTLLSSFLNIELCFHHPRKGTRRMTHLKTIEIVICQWVVSFQITVLHFSLLDYKMHQLLAVLTSL